METKIRYTVESIIYVIKSHDITTNSAYIIHRSITT